MLTKKPSSPTRNQFGPAADRLAVLLALAESSGATAANMASIKFTDLVSDDGDAEVVTIESASAQFASWMAGRSLRITGGTDWTVGPVTISTVLSATQIEVSAPVGASGALTGGQAWISRCGRADNAWDWTVGGTGGSSWVTGEGVDLGVTAFLQGPTNSSGAAWVYELGTLALTAEAMDASRLATIRRLFTTGELVTGAASVGQLSVKLSATGMVVEFGVGGASSVDVTFSRTWVTGDVLTLAVQWFRDSAAVSLAVNGGAPTTQTATPAGWGGLTINDGKSAKIGANTTGAATSIPDITVNQFAWWDWSLSDRELSEVLADAFLPQRPMAPADWLTTRAAPQVGCPREDGTGVTFQFGGADTVVPGTPAGKIRVLVSASPYLVGAVASDWHTMAEADAGGDIRIAVTGLTPATWYFWHAELSLDDGVTAEPFPGGRGMFRTMPWTDIGCYADVHPWLHRTHEDDPMDAVEFGADIERQVEGLETHNSARRLWQMSHDAAEAAYACATGVAGALQVHGWFDGGDTVGPFSGDGGYELEMYNLWKSGSVITVPGNHEQLAGFDQAVTDAEAEADEHYQQRRSVKRWRSVVCNPGPDDTAAGGEDQGMPAEPVDDATVYDPGVDWIPQMSDNAESYMYDYVVANPEGATWAEKLGFNAGPRRTYFAFEINPSTLAVVLDLYSNSRPGDALHDDLRYRQDLELGPGQWDWLDGVMAASTHRHKLIFMHSNLDGVPAPITTGDKFYFRGAVPVLKTAEAIRLHNLMRQCNGTAIVKFHDHGGALAVLDSVNYVTGPTPTTKRWTAVGSAEAGATYPVGYGSPTVRGTDQAHVIVSNPHWGWLKIAVPEDGPATIAFRQTAPDHASQKDMATMTTAVDLIGRYIGPPLPVQHDADGYYVEVSEIPRAVQVVCEATNADFEADGLDVPILTDEPETPYSGLNTFSAGDQGYATTGVANVIPKQYCQPFQSTRINVDASHADSEVRVLHVPRMIPFPDGETEYVLRNATSPVGGGNRAIGIGI